MIPLPDSILTQPLLMLESALPAFIQRFEMLRDRAAAVAQASGAEQLGIGDFIAQRRQAENRDGVAVLHVNGGLAQGTTKIDRLLGMTDYGEITSELEAAAADPAVRAIVLDISSPGGSAVGAPEAAAAVAETRKKKPVISYIGDVGASAAYYLAAASNAIVAQASGLVGSIGTKIQFLSMGSMAAQLGITPHIYTPAASDLKATGTKFRAPTPAESQWLQEHVESMNAAFTSWVQQYRPKVTAQEMRGQVFMGREAVQNGLADATGSLAEAVALARPL